MAYLRCLALMSSAPCHLYSGGPLVEQFKQGDMASQTSREALDTQTETPGRPKLVYAVPE